MRVFFARIRLRVAEWLEGLGPDGFRHAPILLLAMVGYLAHAIIGFSWAQPWYIEDAAISFAYARNWVNGDGLVPWVGGEHVEGYSNALWTYLLGIAYALGVSPWTSSKVFGGIFGCFAQLFAYLLARRAIPGESKSAALLVPWFLAASTQFVVWNSSGLENSLFCMLLAGGLWTLVVEVEDNRRTPWSAGFFFFLAMTRPDGLAYAGIGLIGRTLGTLAHRQWAAWLLWVLAFGLPWGAYNAWRYSYFAWEWPLTWYAKRKAFKPFDYTGNYGWKQLREYLVKYGIVYALPALAIGAAGFTRWRRYLVIGSCAAVAFVALWDGKRGVPTPNDIAALKWIGSHFNDVRVYTISGVIALLGFATFGQKGWLARGLLWCCYSFGLFYTVLATGDWMKAYRWFNLTSVPQFTLLAVGLGILAEWLPFAEKRVRGLPIGRVAWMLIPAVALMAANIPYTQEFSLKPETSPRDVHKRVLYMNWVKDRLDLDRVWLLDVDMGAHLWYTDWFVADIAGLIDVPMAQHEYEKAFVKEYLFEEIRPHFAHSHGSWARTLKVSQHPEWKEQYVEIPGFPTGRRALHVGNHVRKDLLVTEVEPTSTERRVRFSDDVRMETWQLRSPTIAPGGELFVDTLWRAKKRTSGLRVLLFLAKDGALAWSGEVTPGYNWYKPERWQTWEYVKGRWSVEIPSSLPTGEYQLGLVVLDEQVGVVLPVVSQGSADTEVWIDGDDEVEAAPGATLPEGAAPPPAIFMTGEWLFPQTISLVGADGATRAADAAFADAVKKASDGNCEAAEDGWHDARHHVAKNKKWHEAHKAEAQAALVGCLLARAEHKGDDLAKAYLIEQARFIDPRSEAIKKVGVPLGETLDAMGDAAAAGEDWDGAFRHYLAAVQADTTRAMSRRKAEDMRDRRFKIREYDPKKDTKPAGALF